MSAADVEVTAGLAAPSSRFGRERPQRRGRRSAVIAAVLIVLAAVVVAATYATDGTKNTTTGRIDSSSPTSTATVARQNISKQTSVNATLGYSGSYSIVAPSGTSAQTVAQAQLAVAEDEQALFADEQTEAAQSAANAEAISVDETIFNAAKTSLSSDEAKQAKDCAGSGGSSPACAQDQQKVGQDQTQLAQAEQQLATAQSTATVAQVQNQAKVASDKTKLDGDQVALASDQATEINQGTAYTWLPRVGQLIEEDQPVYSVSNEAVTLLYGSITAYRAFYLGMSDGVDVGQLTRDLIALGYGAGLTQSHHYSSATASAVRRWQSAVGLPATGEILLGQVVFEPGPIRVTSVSASVGGSVGGGGGNGGGGGGSNGSGSGGGSVLAASSTTREVTIDLAADQQSQVAVGQRVSIVVPNGTSTPGVISSVGTVATTPSSGGSPTITVEVTPIDPAATGTLDQAPVKVLITTATVNNALVVPVDALLALSTGGYGVEVLDPNGISRVVDVSVGLFDDADGVVQVTGAGLAAGQRIVVPSV